MSPSLWPPDWPRWARRAFLLTIPISGPAWLMCTAVVICGAVALLAFGLTLGFAEQLWSDE